MAAHGTLLAALAVALCLAAAASANLHADAVLAAQFKQFKAEHGKKYATAAEEAHRLGVFRENMRLAEQQNAANPHATFGATKFSDLTRAELDEMFGHGVLLPTDEEMRNAKFAEVKHVNLTYSAVDWREKGAVTRVKNQGRCDSCWAFAVIGTIESAWKIAGNALTELSEQVLVSCDDTNSGCLPGFMERGYAFLLRSFGGKVPTEQSYPYVSADRYVPPCSVANKQVGAVFQDFLYLQRSEQQMAAYLATYGPILTALDYTSFSFYNGGVITNCVQRQYNHAIILVGFNTQTNPPYWIIKNSWGPNWGERGYVRIQYGANTCLVASFPMAAVVNRRSADNEAAAVNAASLSD